MSTTKDNYEHPVGYYSAKKVPSNRTPEWYITNSIASWQNIDDVRYHGSLNFSVPRGRVEIDIDYGYDDPGLPDNIRDFIHRTSGLELYDFQENTITVRVHTHPSNWDTLYED